MSDEFSPEGLICMETHTVATIECLTRKYVQCNFAELVGDRMHSNTLKDFEKVFFELTYPTPVMPTVGTE